RPAPRRPATRDGVAPEPGGTPGARPPRRRGRRPPHLPGRQQRPALSLAPGLRKPAAALVAPPTLPAAGMSGLGLRLDIGPVRTLGVAIAGGGRQQRELFGRAPVEPLPELPRRQGRADDE